MQRYQVHPEHQKVIAHVREICEDVRAVDFETQYAAPDKLEEPDPFRGFRMP
jgi:hypothetical protein